LAKKQNNKKTKKPARVVKKKSPNKRSVKKATAKKKVLVKRSPAKKKTKIRKVVVKRKARVKRKTVKKTNRRKVKKFISLGGMAFANGVMMRTRNNMVIAMADEAGKVEVVSFKQKNIRDNFSFLFAPFMRGILFFIENVYYFLKISWHKRPFVKKNLRQKPKHERLFGQLNQYLIYVIYILLIVGFFNYLYVKLNSGLQLDGIFALYSFLITFLYLCVFVVLFFLVSIARRDELNIFSYHGAEHKIIDTYERGEAVNLRNVEKSRLINDRCSITVFFWAAVILSFLITFLNISAAGWLMGFLITLGLIFISFSFAYEIVKFAYSSGLSLLTWIFIKPLRIIQYVLTYNPDEKHIRVGLVAYDEVMRMEKAG